MSEKFVVLLIDGLADFPVEELGGKTPLEEAQTPVLDGITEQAEVGLVRTVPDGFEPGSDVANMSVLGYAPEKYYTGRSPFEALSMGVSLDKDEVSLRCNLVTLSQNRSYRKRVMKDYSAGEINSNEAQKLIAECQKQLGSDSFTFYAGVSYRHLLVWKGGHNDIVLTPPHDISDKVIGGYLPQGSGSGQLCRMMEKSGDFLPGHPVNSRRKERGDLPGNSIWLWGVGTSPRLDMFSERYGLRGSVISAVDLIKGLGRAAGLQVIDVPGVTGRIDTNFSGKAQAAVRALQEGDDFVFLHFEAADEAGHQGDVATKKRAVEKIDQLVLKQILAKLDSTERLSLLILPDHYTPVAEKTHTRDPVPFLIYRSYRPGKQEFRVSSFSEKNAAQTGFFLEEGHHLMDYFLEKNFQ